MRQAWRIVKEKHAATAFTGEGAARTGGRWNSRGNRVVYASSTTSLAALENLVHLNPPILFSYVAFRIRFDPALLEKIAHPWPADWREQPPPPSTMAIGDRWVREARSAVLEVPSVIIPGEVNYLLNPAHPDFPKILIRKAAPFAFDPRLLV
ncbi:MAG TPA: RES family NAD+ phosphorylase [Chthoniobacteraceae bacterium]|jgi:RES domain-containing protein|nr:RES family NAD+ phosphorylase [Chthoniobacteraceae bacterium]